jgi:uncharacterized membrane protein
MKIIAGLFDTYQEAENAIDKLRSLGITREQIGVLARDTVLQERAIGTDAETSPEHVGVGAIGGTAVGGLIGLVTGLSAITVPGIGPVLTTGAILTALGSTAAGAGIGAATGGIIGALTSVGIPEEDAQVYAESVQRGGILLTVETDDGLAMPVMEALDRANAVDIAARREELRRGGWERFNESHIPAPGEQRAVTNN